MAGWKENIAEQQQKLDALKRGSVSFVADQSIIHGSMDPHFIRDGNGLVIGGRGGAYIDGGELRAKYGQQPDTLVEAGYSSRFGAYAIIFDVS